MGIYQDRIFPKLNDHFLGAVEVDDIRAELLGNAVGHVLEIGSGAGCNFVYYSRAITSLTTVDPSEAMNRVARRTSRHFSFPIDQRTQSVETLTAKDDSFDTVVSTFVLCSVKDLRAGLAQIKRVLKTGGRFLFLERSRSPDDNVARWQRKLTPLHRAIGNGSHLDRAIAEEIAAAGFEISRCDETILPRLPRAFGSIIYGVATLPMPS